MSGVVPYVDAQGEAAITMRANDGQVDLEEVFRSHYNRIARVIAGVIPDQARAEELPVEVLLKWSRHPTAHGKGVEGWLYRAVGVWRHQIYGAQKRIHSDRKATVDAIIASGATTGSRALIEAIASIYSSAVPQTPRISLTGIERAAILYPAHPVAPDFKRVKASDCVAPQFAEEAVKARP